MPGKCNAERSRARAAMSETLERLRSARRIGFLFSGGASRCVFQVGAVEALYAFGIRPSVCLGVSAGAWNAAAVAVGNWHRLRAYWRFFCRMPAVDVRNLLTEELTPYNWRKLHERAFRRYVSTERLHDPATLPLYVALTRLRDRAPVILDVREAHDPLRVMLASNYLPPFYTRTPVIDGERYGDGAFTDNAPYEQLFELGCDFVVIIAQKGLCEGGLFRNADDPDHGIGEAYRHRVVVIRPHHPLPISFTERRWERLVPIADLGASRTREIVLEDAASDHTPCTHRVSPSVHLIRGRNTLRRMLASLRERVRLRNALR